eukprot:TRINITY_DN2718_c0_g1_i1.p1 TRINITY_DN2718_c0_g1~~TRINITY_DN2718_c0_g1_i1.p1  ORF type:complete len:129 (-),score=41.30 TRINITY_DN2718_c0_g1_i1:189-575(-)
MLQELVRQHKAAQVDLLHRNEQRRQAAVQSVGKVTSALLDTVNSGVAEVFMNQEDLEREVKQLQAQSIKLSKSTKNWVGLMNEMSGALKELGHVESWAGALETDMREIATTLQYVNEQNRANHSQDQQ